MKLAIRIFALSVVVAGAAAASVSSQDRTHAIASHQSATSSLPAPGLRTLHMRCPSQLHYRTTGNSAAHSTKVPASVTLFI